jgi:hypothetical protein
MITSRLVTYLLLSFIGLTMSPIVSAQENETFDGTRAAPGLSETRATGTLVMQASIPGRPASGMTLSPNGSWQLDRKDAFDLDGDGVADRPYLQFEDDSPHHLVALVVSDGANPENRWTVSLMEHEGLFYFSQPASTTQRASLAVPADVTADHREGPTLVRFVELDRSNDLKEIVMADKRGRHLYNPLIVDADGKLVSHITDGTSNTILLGIFDVDGDGSSEIIVYNPTLVQVEIWGEPGS